MRKVALDLESVVDEELKRNPDAFGKLGWKSKADLIGEYYAYNIVDGFLFLVGHEFCSINSCKHKTSSCPFAGDDLCDSREEKLFKYDRQEQLFIKTELSE